MEMKGKCQQLFLQNVLLIINDLYVVKLESRSSDSMTS